jgi:hypothetical protein
MTVYHANGTRSQADTSAPLAQGAPGTRRERALATLRERAATLLEDGYRFHAWTRLPGRFDCVTPLSEHAARKEAGRPRVYTLEVRVSGTQLAAYTCDCPAFAEYARCKHGERLKAEIEKALSLAAAVLGQNFATAPRGPHAQQMGSAPPPHAGWAATNKEADFA